MLTTRSSTGEHWGVFCILALQTDYSVSSLLADARLFLLEIYVKTRFLDHRMSIFKLKFKGCPHMTDQFMLSPVKLGGPISPHLIMDANALLFSNLIGLKWHLFIIFFGSFMHRLSLAAVHRFSLQWLLLWSTVSSARAQNSWHTGLVGPWHVESSWTRGRQTHVPCIGRQILNH